MTLLATPPSQDQSRRRITTAVLDPILVGLAALAIYAVHGFQNPLKRDLGVFVYGGEQFSHGVPPYVGVFNTVGPLADALPGSAIWFGRLLGLDPVLSARLLYLVLSAICCALVSVLARDTFRSRTAALLAPAVFLTFECFTELASSGPREKTAMLVFLLGSLILVGRRRWFGAGVLAALSTLVWQPVILVAIGTVLVAVLTTRSGRLRALVRFAVGGLVPTVIAAAYFVIEGAARQALDGFVVVNARYTTQPTIFNNWVLQQFWHTFHASIFLVVIGLVAMLVLAVRAVPHARKPGEDEPTVAWRLTAMGAGALVSIVWTICVVNGGPDLFVVLPFAALGLAGALMHLVARLPVRVAVPVVATLVVAGVVIASLQSLTSRQTGLDMQRADARDVLRTQPPRAAQILSIDAPQALAVTSRKNLWPYQLFDVRMAKFFDDSLPGGTAGLAEKLQQERPTFVVVGSKSESVWQQGTLAVDYTRVGSGPGWVWYISNDAGHQALLAARAANRAAMGRPAAPVR